VCLAAYAACAFACVAARARGSSLERARWPAGVLGAGVAASAVAVWVRWERTGQGPFLTLFDVLLSNVFSLGLVALVAWSLVPLTRAGAPLVAGVLAALAAWSLTVPVEATPLPATFDNPWLWVHVLSGKLFLGTCLVATGLAAPLVGRWRRSDAGSDGGPNAGPDAGSKERRGAATAVIWDLLRLAFAFQTLMLVAGAGWARDAWGRYWGWDPLETSALVTWLALGALLHVNVRWPLASAATAWGTVTVFALAHLTFLGVPFLSAAPHKGIAW
jgi:ABC-type transport system involved in cytochrome c biogenesis permease subunit